MTVCLSDFSSSPLEFFSFTQNAFMACAGLPTGLNASVGASGGVGASIAVGAGYGAALGAV